MVVVGVILDFYFGGFFVVMNVLGGGCQGFFVEGFFVDVKDLCFVVIYLDGYWFYGGEFSLRKNVNEEIELDDF